MDLGLANGIYSNKLEGNATGLYNSTRTGLHNGIYNENIIDNGIVKNGLVLYLDAANPYSSPYGSTTWNDLSGNNYNGKLTNGPIYNTLNKGCIQFDGINDYIVFPTSTFLNFCEITNDLPFTISTWCYINNLTFTFNLCNKGDNGNGILESYWLYINTNGTFAMKLYDTSGANQSISTTTSTVPTLTWVNLTAVYSGTGGNNGISLYINGLIQNKTNSSIGTYSRMRVQNSELYLGSLGSTGIYKDITSNGRYASFLFYNKELKQSEINQNYLATKSRFNL